MTNQANSKYDKSFDWDPNHCARVTVEFRYVSQLSFVSIQIHQLLVSVISKPICGSQNPPVPQFSPDSQAFKILTLVSTVDPTHRVF